MVVNVVQQLPLYQQTIQSFKNDGYSVIGYTKKFKTKESNETRSNLLDMMCNKLKTRSMVDKVFMPFKTSSNDPTMDRDLDDSSKVLEKIDVDGNTQGKNAIVGSFFTNASNVEILRYVSMCFC